MCRQTLALSDRAVVVGGGLAGLSAACELLERGCNVTIIEKEENLGGISAKATCGIAAPGSFLHQQDGVKDLGKDLIDSPSADSFVKKAPGDVEWLSQALGIKDELTLRLTPGHDTARTIGTKTHFPGAVITYAAAHLLQQVASVKPDRLEIIASAQVVALLKTGSQVTGVQYLKNGQTSSLHGAVVLACGGYGGDRTMLEQCAPQVAHLPTANDARASGDAIKLGAQVSAATEKLDEVQMMPTAAVISGHEASDLKAIISDAICGAGGKLIDADGKRFCNELADAQERVEAMGKAKGPFRLVISAQKAEAVPWLIDFYTSRKVMTRYKNQEQLATAMGVSSTALNSSDLGLGEVFVGVVTPAIFSCAGGLSTSEVESPGAVLSTSGKPIEGLFAAGEAVASPFARLWSVSGIPMLYCIHSGRMAGKSAAEILTTGEAQDLRHLVISSMTLPHRVVEGTATPKEAQTAVETVERSLKELTKEELIAKVEDLQANGAKPKDDGPKGISMEEVKKHNTKEDAWCVINGDVIDVTKWIPLHPGGEQAIVAYLGMDASDEWNMIHKPGTVEKNLVPAGGNGPVNLGKLGGGAPVGGGVAAAASGLTMDEVGKHTTEADLWIVVNGKAYDVTKWTQVHPGGVSAITAFAGKDASDEWNCIHKPGTIEKNLYPGNPNGPVDKGPVAGVAAAPVQQGPIDDEAPAPQGSGCMTGPIGAVYYLAKNLVLMLLRTVFFTGNFRFTVENNRKGTIRSACFLLAFSIIHVLGNFVGMIKGPNEANGEGYFFDRIAWTGGLGYWKEGPFGLSAVEEYLALALLLHVCVALKRSWDISMNYTISSGRWNMMLSGLTLLFFLTVHLSDIRFSSEMQYTELRPPPYFVSFSGLLEGRVFFETDESIPLQRVRDIYTREVELFKDLGKCFFYTICIAVFWIHMVFGWQKLVPADAMQIPKDHVKVVTYLGWLAATAIVSMYLSVVWYTYLMPAEVVAHVA